MENDKPFVKSPAFQIYPADFLADAKTLVMSAAEIGAYWLLLCVCWRENGLPDDVAELAAIARTPVKQFQNSWEKRIQRCFVKRDDEKWTHNRLQKERDKQMENREARKAAGSKGAAGRWQTDNKPIADASDSHTGANGKPMAKNGLSSSSSSSSSISSSSVKKERPSIKQRDERIDHPAMVAFREIKGKFPNKDVWDLVIKSVGLEPDLVRMRECWLAWRGRDFRPDNLGWLVDWYANGIPASGGNGRGVSKVEQSIEAAKRVVAKYEQRG